MNKHTLSGRCLCGSVTIAATPTKQHIEACHCDMCRKWGGAAYLAVQCGDQFDLAGNEHITRFQSSPWAERGFCSKCGANLFYHFTPAGNYSFAAGLFNQLENMPLTEEIFVDEQPEYYSFAQETQRKTGAQIIKEAKAAGFEF